MGRWPGNLIGRRSPPAPAAAPPSAPEDGTAVYNGERLPKWLVRDLMQERAAIREYCGGMTRETAHAITAVRAANDSPPSAPVATHRPTTAAPQRQSMTIANRMANKVTFLFRLLERYPGSSCNVAAIKKPEAHALQSNPQSPPPAPYGGVGCGQGRAAFDQPCHCHGNPAGRSGSCL